MPAPPPAPRDLRPESRGAHREDSSFSRVVALAAPARERGPRPAAGRLQVGADLGDEQVGRGPRLVRLLLLHRGGIALVLALEKLRHGNVRTAVGTGPRAERVPEPAAHVGAVFHRPGDAKPRAGE